MRTFASVPITLACCLFCMIPLKVCGAPQDDALLDAVRSGDAKKVEELLSKGANVNAKDVDGFTPLMEASVEGSTEVVKLLLAKGADVNAKNEDGDTALIGASFAGHTELVKMPPTKMVYRLCLAPRLKDGRRS
jgi:ankyrin repeat protein